MIIALFSKWSIGSIIPLDKLEVSNPWSNGPMVPANHPVIGPWPEFSMGTLDSTLLISLPQLDPCRAKMGDWSEWTHLRSWKALRESNLASGLGKWLAENGGSSAHKTRVSRGWYINYVHLNHQHHSIPLIHSQEQDGLYWSSVRVRWYADVLGAHLVLLCWCSLKSWPASINQSYFGYLLVVNICSLQ